MNPLSSPLHVNEVSLELHFKTKVSNKYVFKRAQFDLFALISKSFV